MSGLHYFDMGLFVLGIFTDLVLVKGKSIWKYLVFIYIVRKTLKNKGKTVSDCPCCDVYNITFVYTILREIMHIAMFGMVSCKLYADNFAVEGEYSKSREPAEGSYRIEGMQLLQRGICQLFLFYTSFLSICLCFIDQPFLLPTKMMIKM